MKDAKKCTFHKIVSFEMKVQFAAPTSTFPASAGFIIQYSTKTLSSS